VATTTGAPFPLTRKNSWPVDVPTNAALGLSAPYAKALMLPITAAGVISTTWSPWSGLSNSRAPRATMSRAGSPGFTVAPRGPLTFGMPLGVTVLPLRSRKNVPSASY